MWREILDYGRQLLMLTQTTERNTEDIKELRQEFDQLAGVTRHLTYTLQHEIASLRQEIQHMRESERQARENEMLRIENALLRSGKQLPPGNPAPEHPRSDEEE